MRRNYFWMMLIAMASVLSFSSCSKDDEPSKDELIGAKHSVEIQELDFALYDFTVTYTDLMSETVQTKKMLTPTWTYECFRTGIKRPSPYVLKIIGTPKSNAANIAKDLASKGKEMKAGAIYSFKAGKPTDYSMTDFWSTFVSVVSTAHYTIPANKIEEHLAKNSTITVINEEK